MTVALVLCITLGTAVVIKAQDEVISRIIVEGNKRVPTETLLNYVTFEQGDRFDERIVKTDFLALWNTGLFSDIKILKRPDGEGKIALIIRVEERPKIRHIIYEGLKAISESKIEEKMSEPPNDFTLEEGSLVSNDKLSRVAGIINGLMDEQGLEFGEVSYELRPIKDNDVEVDVVFLVNEGGKVKIKDVVFTGNKSFSQWQLMKVLKKSRPTWLLSWIQKDNIYSSKLLDQDLEGLREFYADNGFLLVSIQDPIVETLQDKPLLSGRDMRARIIIPINEGNQYKINKIKFEGAQILADEALRFIFKLKEGDLFNRKKLKDSTDDISEIYRNQGYIDAFVSEDISYPRDKKGYIDLTIKINEGEPFFINKISFKGNRTTRDKVLRRNIFLVEQQPFSLQGFQDSMRRLNQLGFFGSVEPHTNVNQKDKTVDIEFDVTETGRNQVQFGGGYSGLEGGFFNFAFSTSNFWGQGQTLSLMVQTGQLTKNYTVSFFDPWLFDKPVGAGISFFSRTFEFEDFLSKGEGGTANISWHLGRFLSLFTEYRYELIELRTSDNLPFSNNLFFPEGRTATGSITPTIIRNTVDHPLLPTKGHRDTIRFEFGSKFLGGDFSFYKAILEHISNFSITSTDVFRFRAQLGYSETLENNVELPVFERFFMGGENTIRGYKLRTVGPRDEYGRIIGGTKSLLFNVENAILITNEIRIVPFLDAGNAFAKSIDLGGLQYSAGIELRFFVPVMNVPFRFIYAKPINPKEYHQTSSFLFTIGSIF